MGGDAGEAFGRLVEIMARLRGPDGCPWDRAQTLGSLRRWLLEETYEVLEAIDQGTPEQHREELGDLLLQVVFQARLREEEGLFSVAEVADAIAEKMVRRHPHVFAGAAVRDAAEQSRRWSDIKRAERGGDRGALDGVPRATPALLRALRVGEKAAHAGFDWSAPAEVLEKLDEEREELRAALADHDRAAVEQELGDVLFTVVNLCRHVGVDPEAALRGTVRRFERRYRQLEADLRAEGQDLRGLDPAALETRWQQVKRSLAEAD